MPSLFWRPREIFLVEFCGLLSKRLRIPPTLVRHNCKFLGGAVRDCFKELMVDLLSRSRSERGRRNHRIPHPYEKAQEEQCRKQKLPGDRKSTRLNSSHVAISYA